MCTHDCSHIEPGAVRQNKTSHDWLLILQKEPTNYIRCGGHNISLLKVKPWFWGMAMILHSTCTLTKCIYEWWNIIYSTPKNINNKRDTCTLMLSQSLKDLMHILDPIAPAEISTSVQKWFFDLNMWCNTYAHQCSFFTSIHTNESILHSHFLLKWFPHWYAFPMQCLLNVFPHSASIHVVLQPS